jgi:uncharacterized protein YbjT (DUF2867 family)
MIALTGATGFIGSYLLRELIREGHAVRVLLRSPTPLSPDGTNAVIGDLDRPINMAPALAGVDTIIHSAGLSSQMTGTPEADFRRLNAEATGRRALMLLNQKIFFLELRALHFVAHPHRRHAAARPLHRRVFLALIFRFGLGAFAGSAIAQCSGFGSG